MARGLRANRLSNVDLPKRYVVLDHVARGGMASVWCAEDSVLGRRVAIKLLDERFAHDQRSVARFKREARTAARLSRHRNVVTIYDVAEADGRPFIVMEYLDGGTVAARLRQGPVPRAEALCWLREAAEALDYAHGAGVVHRDIKPANLLLDRAGVLHIGDFGIARQLSEDTITATGQLFGTAAYLAPEQALGQSASAASDRYSLTVAAFELLVGARPFTAEHFAAQARQHIEDEPPRASRHNNQLPGALDRVLVKGMAKDASARWATAGALVDAIERALTRRAPRPGRAADGAAAGSATVAWTPQNRPGDSRRPDGGPMRRGLGRHRRRAGALGALAAVAFAAGLIAAAANHGGSGTMRAARSQSTAKSVAAHPPTRTPTAPAHHRAASPTTSTATPARPTVTTHAAAPAGGDATALEARGHQLMLSGNYAPAIGVLEHAVAAASPGGLTYAYALYDLGHTLRVAGNPKAAILVLARRLQIPNQTGVVRNELQLAMRQAAGTSTGGANPGAASGGAAVGPHGHHSRGGGD